LFKLKQLIDVFERYNSSVVSVQEVLDEDVSKYGIIESISSEIEPGVLQLETLVEKLKLGTAPSNFGIMGRYILRPEIFDILADLPPGSGGEIQLTDAMKSLNEQQEVLACRFDGARYDIGNKFGFVQATLDFALKREDLKEDMMQYLEQIIDSKNVKK
jgi:UTP--glucose-1-phosphate uridylyltransferase